MKPNILLLLLLFYQPVFSQLNEVNYSINNIEANTKYSEFGASYFGPNKIVFASSKQDRRILRNKSKTKNNKLPKYNLYEGFLNLDGEINHTKKLLDEYTTKYNESNVSFTPDLKYAYFTQNNISEGKYVENSDNWINLNIYRAEINSNGQWINIISMPFNDDSYSCAFPTVSEDGKILFFTSDMPGGYGSSDIYWTSILEDGKYGEPQNIGPHVNSMSKDNFPYVDGNILYFSSNRPESHGGLDIFMVDLNDPGSKPINLGSTINSKYDDFCFIIDRDKKTGFFSSNRPEGKGDDDLYFFKQNTDITFCKQIINGKIKDNETNKSISGAIISLYSHDNILVATYPVKIDGKFQFELACRGNYRIEASKKYYDKSIKLIKFIENTFTQNVELSLSKQSNSVSVTTDTPKVNVDTKKLPVIYRYGKLMLDVKPIYFELDEYYITKEAEKTIKEVIQILKDFPNVNIEIGSHTDCRSSNSYNLHLSSLRAKEVEDYLKKNKINKYRIRSRGYGESRLVNKCKDGVECSEGEHLLNRRIEFVVTNK